MNDEEIMRRMGLPSYWKAEWLRPGGQIELPEEASKDTKVLPGGQLCERWPGAWSGIPQPGDNVKIKHRLWWQFWKFN